MGFLKIKENRLPDFIICGTQKGGTTSLYEYLRHHPEVYLPKKKEIHFFDLNLNKGLRWYLRHFVTNNIARIKGEATPSYMYFEEVPRRIRRILPNVRLIFILRNPVDRAYSHYWHEVKLGYEHLSFEDAIRMEKKRLFSGGTFEKIHYSYIDRGKYAIQLRRFMKYFPKNQLLILLFDDLKGRPLYILKQLYAFLGINPTYMLKRVRKYNIGAIPRIRSLQRLRPYIPFSFGKLIIDAINLRPGYPPMRPTIRRILVSYFENYNQELEKILGKPLPHSWYTI